MNTLFKIRNIIFSAIFIILSSNSFAQDQESTNICNYLGTGSNPHIKLELSANGANWGAFTIDYNGCGGVPTPSPYDATNNWSSWNVKDTSGNYYGTITLTISSSNIVSYNNYVAPSPATGYYLDGITFCVPNSSQAVCGDKHNYSLVVNSIHQPTINPFPNAPRATAPANFNLSVQGTNIMLNNSTPVKLKGVVRPSLEWNNQGQYLSVADIVNMHKFGANTIRLDLNANFWNSSAGANTNGSYKQIVDAIIYYAQQNNMIVILDYHWTNTTVQQEEMVPNNSTAINFWTSVASAYKNFGNVIFELYNEPNTISNNQWLNGDSNYLGMQQMYDLIRAQGANNIVIVNGLDWGYYLGFLNNNDTSCNGSNCFLRNSDGSLATNVIYGSHPYNTKGSTTYTYNGSQADFATNFAGVQNVAPIIFTEFGDNTQADYSSGVWQNVYNADLAEINSNNINYTGFAWWEDDSQPWFPTLITGGWTNPTANNYAGSLIGQDLINNPGTTFSAIN